MVTVKICGITTESDLVHAIHAGADRVGFVLAPNSPRHVSFEQVGKLVALALDAQADPWVVAGWRAAGGEGQDDLERFISETPELGAVQLHTGETAADIAHFAARFPLTPLVKAIGVSARRDLEQVEDFPKADEFLFDAKPPKGADREGGLGRSFDWSILKGFDAGDYREWTLAGGLHPGNIAEAIRISGARAVDVSSGVEASPGVKDAAKVRAFIEAAKAAG
jgi:phosphoribosylanthranilate isomerase